MKLQDYIESATIKDATEWSNTDEKFIFCIDKMMISAHSCFADKWVEALELKYEEILSQ